MFTSRILTRTLARRQPLNARLPIQRRLNSTAAESAKEKGNAFIKEREAVKHHAAQSSGTSLPHPRSLHSRLADTYRVLTRPDENRTVA